MTEEERRRIEAEQYSRARTENRIQNLESALKDLSKQVVWGVRAVWGGIAYLAFRLIEFVLNGGSLK